MSRGPHGVNTRTVTNFVKCHRCHARQATTAVSDPAGNTRELICDGCMDAVKREIGGRFNVVRH